jgi:succinyl-diaminopimelate desuccinylase
VRLPGALEISGTVDEESGGLAGMAWLAERGRVRAGRTDYVIIPEPLDVDRVCIGHRGVYWFEVQTRGRTAHGSMPFLGTSAIDQMAVVLEAVRTELGPALAERHTGMPVVPAAAARATVNVNAISGGQDPAGIQTPCVADRCRAVFDRRFLPEEAFDAVRAEIVALLERTARRLPGLRYTLSDLMVVAPVLTPADSPLVTAVTGAVADVLGHPATLVASPGTYDHKHVTRIGGIVHCVAYGPGSLERAHQPDEWCGVPEIVNATRVLALTLMRLARGTPGTGPSSRAMEVG